MAFGLSPKFIQDFALENLSNEQFLVLATEAAKKLEWDISQLSESGFIAFTKFSMRSTGEEIKVRIENGNANLKSECTGNQMTDWGRNKQNIQHFVSVIEELKNTMAPDEFEKKYEDLKPNMIQGDQDILNESPISSKEKITGILAIFKPVQGYFITPVIIDLNILIFISMAVSGANILLPDNETLIAWGANFRPATLDGQWWRLITNCFLHIGIFHLLMNMYALLYIGVLLEPYLGRTRFLAAYVSTGIVASSVSLYWHNLTISAGASGAIFGMYGVFLALLTTNFIEKTARKALLTSIGVFVGYNLLNGMKGGIDNAAHIGGLLSGMLIGYGFVPSLKKAEFPNLKYITTMIVSALALGIAYTVYKKTPDDIGKYDAGIKQFVSNESQALELFKMKRDSPKDSILYEIKERGLYYWDENINLINSLEKLNLPDQLHEKDQKLLSYCELREKSYNLIYKAVSEDTDQYKDSLEYYNREIERLVNSLKESK
ncbi:MAG: rhomboid family intramembrane serine protease [Bacteroidetes bacterium]|nr:rhomboid family intramembrane serine protease [Bacteroidota bacterium]